MDFSLSDEQVALRDSIRKAPIDDWTETLTEDEHAGRFSWAGWKRFAELGYLGLPLPPEHGGSGADLLTTLVAIETLGQRCRDSGLVHALVSQMLCGMQIATYGTDEQKQSYLPRIATGEIVCAQALTEPDAGSDVAAIRTRAERRRRGVRPQRGQDLHLEWPDRRPRHRLRRHRSRTQGPRRPVLLPRREGRSRDSRARRPIEKMGLRTLQNGEIVLQDCRVPASAAARLRGAGHDGLQPGDGMGEVPPVRRSPRDDAAGAGAVRPVREGAKPVRGGDRPLPVGVAQDRQHEGQPRAREG